jgi:hypothetical protein
VNLAPSFFYDLNVGVPPTHYRAHGAEVRWRHRFLGHTERRYQLRPVVHSLGCRWNHGPRISGVLHDIRIIKLLFMRPLDWRVSL